MTPRELRAIEDRIDAMRRERDVGLRGVDLEHGRTGLSERSRNLALALIPASVIEGGRGTWSEQRFRRELKLFEQGFGVGCPREEMSERAVKRWNVVVRLMRETK